MTEPFPSDIGPSSSGTHTHTHTYILHPTKRPPTRARAANTHTHKHTDDTRTRFFQSWSLLCEDIDENLLRRITAKLERRAPERDNSRLVCWATCVPLSHTYAAGDDYSVFFFVFVARCQHGAARAPPHQNACGCFRIYGWDVRLEAAAPVVLLCVVAATTMENRSFFFNLPAPRTFSSG